MQIRARHYRTGQPLDIQCEQGVIRAVTPAADAAVSDWVAPAFFDLQINGAHGHSFNSAALTAAGVVVAIGHTAADAGCIRAAIDAGARLSTHLGNGSHAMLPRHDNYVWEQLAADELWASIICDGHHLPPAVMRCILRVKTPARIILTCDAGSLAGLPPGRYREWDQELEVLPEGKIVVPGTSYLAGSWAFTDRCVGTVMRLAEVSLADALDMAGARPRELLGLPPRKFEPGFPADLFLFDWQAGSDIEVKATVVGGEIQPADGA